MSAQTATPNKGLFITGTDTEVGKTWVGTQLAAKLHASMEASLSVRKPVESGCDTLNGERIPADATAYHHAIHQTESLTAICPYRFAEPLSPPEAADKEDQHLSLQSLIEACRAPKDHFLLVEGAGGICSPIADDGLNIDLAKALNLPILLVVEARLGCINHAILSARAIQYEGLRLHGIFLNAKTDYPHEHNAALAQYISAPLFSNTDELLHSLV